CAMATRPPRDRICRQPPLARCSSKRLAWRVHALPADDARSPAGTPEDRCRRSTPPPARPRRRPLDPAAAHQARARSTLVGCPAHEPILPTTRTAAASAPCPRRTPARGGHHSSSPASILIGKVAQVGNDNVPKLTQ